MVAAVGPSSSPTYVAALASAPPPTQGAQSSGSSSTPAEQPAVGSPPLAPSTVAALVAQQARESAAITGAASPSDAGASAQNAASSTGSPAGKPDGQGPWDYDALNQAVVAVNDTSGKTSLSDQMNAYEMLTKYANTGTDVGDTRKAIVNGWLSSPVTAQVQSTLNQFSAAAWTGHGTSYSQYLQKRQSAFDGLSSDQQQMLYAGQGSISYASENDFAASFGNPSSRAAVSPMPSSGDAEALSALKSINDQLSAGRAAVNSDVLSLFEPKSGKADGAVRQGNSATAKSLVA
jgi:hypothetical protein